jgi:hypothetical protein
MQSLITSRRQDLSIFTRQNEIGEKSGNLTRSVPICKGRGRRDPFLPSSDSAVSEKRLDWEAAKGEVL